MLTRRTTFTLLIHSLSDDGQIRALALMRAVHEHAGRAWVMLDAPIAGMPPRILGMREAAQ
jgi:hypothetical protein